MRPDKRSLVVVGMLLVIVTFIIIYAMMIMGEEPTDKESLEDPVVPELKEEPEEFETRLEAVDKLSEDKPVSPPGLYDEDLIDDQGKYDPYLAEKEKVALMDSILRSGPDLEDYRYEDPSTNRTILPVDSTQPVTRKIQLSQIGHGHSGFFMKAPKAEVPEISIDDSPIRVEVNGDQIVRIDERLELKLVEPLIIKQDTIPSNTIFYGFCSFQPNRLLLKVYEVGKMPLQMEAYDISDGQQGIYIENSFRSQAATEVIEDVIQDINVSGVPQVSGLKGIFQRSNRSVKVKVLHQYQLYLKPIL